ncbi:SH3 domain-containing protein [Streptomyces sp. NPDC048272]|uniref:SH3 domain-containing protein n=1 Tax=Streptomyces sp. NPDC048272 TaxID=3154616 RepID=UPI003448F225
MTMKLRTRVAATASLALALTAGGVVTATSASAAGGCYITASAANVRSSPSTSARINGVAYRGWGCTTRDSAYVNGWSWYKIRIDRTGVTGWVRSDLMHHPEEDIHTCIPELPCR